MTADPGCATIRGSVGSKERVKVLTYFNSMLLANEVWWLTTKDDRMNFHLLQTPNKVRPYSKTQYIYKPSVVSQSCTLKPGEVVCVVGVTEGADAGSTAVKVMRSSTFLNHIEVYRKVSECTRIESRSKVEDDICACEYTIEDMPHPMRSDTFIVLLKDLGK